MRSFLHRIQTAQTCSYDQIYVWEEWQEREKRHACLLDVRHEPVQSLIESGTGSSDSGLNVPPLRQRVQVEPAADILLFQRAGKILLVREHKHNHVSQRVFLYDAVKLFLCFAQALFVRTVHHEDQGLAVLAVMMPQAAELGEGKRAHKWHSKCKGHLLLTSGVPAVEAHVLVLDGLDIEACAE